jgi:hypothetical protein
VRDAAGPAGVSSWLADPASARLRAGALIAIDRGDRRIGAVLHEAARHGIDAVTSSVRCGGVARSRATGEAVARAGWRDRKLAGPNDRAGVWSPPRSIGQE